RGRNFGPDAPPKNKRKPPRKDGDRGPRGPIKERPVGRLYDADEDWRAQDEDPDLDDLAATASGVEGEGEDEVDAQGEEGIVDDDQDDQDDSQKD
nr:hypothetical protein [Acidobacteriota bacterium]